MYRHNVCAVLINQAKDKVLMFHRVGSQENGWQFPQGGVDQGEAEEAAFYRELEEEIGTSEVDILKIADELITYDFPQWVMDRMKEQGWHKEHQYRGQQQRWYLAALRHGTDSLHFTHEPVEFDAFEWVSPKAVIERIISFKREAVRKGLSALGLDFSADQSDPESR